MAVLDLTEFKNLITSAIVQKLLSAHNLKKEDIEEIKFKQNYSIDNCVFKDFTSLKKVENIRFAKSIGKFAFKNCISLEEIDLRYLPTIQQGAFSGCKNLKKVIFAKDAAIKEEAFADCSSLKTLSNSQHVKSYCSTSFQGCSIDTSKFFKTEPVTTAAEELNSIKEEVHFAINDIRKNEDSPVIQNMLCQLTPALQQHIEASKLAESAIYKVALCTIARLENAYIREFIEHYCKLGIDKVYLYDTNLPGTEKFEDVILDYIKNGFVEVIPWHGHIVTQEVLDAYCDCYSKHKDDYEWICFFDPDEYLHLQRALTIKQYLSDNIFKDFDVVHVNWKVYNDNDLLENDGRLLAERFTEACQPENVFTENRRVKSIVRGHLHSQIAFLNPHTPEYIDKDKQLLVCNNEGTIVANNITADINFSLAYLKHYRCKTITEYVLNKIPKLTMTGYCNMCFDDEFFFKLNRWTQQKQDLYDKLISKFTAKNYNCDKKNYKYSVLAVNADVKQKLKDPQFYDSEAEFVYLTDNIELKSTIWNVKSIKAPVTQMNAKKMFPKFHPFQFTSSDVCIYVDPSIAVLHPLDQLVDAFKQSEAEIGLMLHPDRCSAEDELAMQVQLDAFPRDKADEILKFYESKKYASKSLYSTSIIVFKDTQKTRQLCELMWNLLEKFGESNNVLSSDQVMLPYAVDEAFKDCKLDKVFMMSPAFISSQYFQQYQLDGKKSAARRNSYCLVDGKLVVPYMP